MKARRGWVTGLLVLGALPAAALAQDIVMSFDAARSPDIYARIRNHQFPLCVKTGHVLSPTGVEEAANYRCARAATGVSDQTAAAVFGPESAPIYGWGPAVFGEAEANQMRQRAADYANTAAAWEQWDRNLFTQYVSRDPQAMACYQRDPACRAQWDAWLHSASQYAQGQARNFHGWSTAMANGLAGIQAHLTASPRPAGGSASGQGGRAGSASGPAGPAGQQGILGVCIAGDPNCR